ARRRAAGRVFARDVPPVLQLPERLQHLLVVEHGRIGGEPLELCESPREPAPQGSHLCGVTLSDPPRRCHNRMLLAGDRVRSPAVAQQASVLVVEDDASLRLLARVNLELEQFRVREAGTLDEAREAVAAERPALVFLDVHLHGVATDVLLDELRRAGIPVVVVTGTADITQYRDRANQVLSKPFEPSALVAAARRFVG